MEPKGLISQDERTTEINPERIACALNGVLRESKDRNSQWNIFLSHGSEQPLTLKLDPEKRTLFLASPSWSGGYRFVVQLIDIEGIRFVQYRLSPDSEIQTDILFYTSSDKNSASLILSSATFLTFS